MNQKNNRHISWNILSDHSFGMWCPNTVLASDMEHNAILATAISGYTGCRKTEFYRIEHFQICHNCHKYFFPFGGRIFKSSVWLNLVFFKHPVLFARNCLRNTKKEMYNILHILFRIFRGFIWHFAFIWFERDSLHKIMSKLCFSCHSTINILVLSLWHLNRELKASSLSENWLMKLFSYIFPSL